MSLNCLEKMPSSLIADLNRIFTNQHNAEKNVVGVRQRLAAKQNGQGRKSINGLGQPYLQVDDFAYHYWGQRLGYKCWKDKQFLKEFWRDNEACRIKAGGTRIQSGYGGLSSGITKKFSKKY